MTRAQQAEIATKLQTILNNGEYNGDYKIYFDACESGMTDCYYKGELYKQVPNDEMKPSMSVSEFSAPTELKIRLHFGF